MDDRFAYLRELLSQEPSTQGWDALVALFEGWEGPELSTALVYAKAHLASWPAQLRVAPTHWVCPPRSDAADLLLRGSTLNDARPRRELLALACDPCATYAQNLPAPSAPQPTRWKRNAAVELPFSPEQRPLRATLAFHHNTVMAMHLVPEVGLLASADFDGHWAIWDEKSLSLLAQGHAQDRHSRLVRLSPDGQTLALVVQRDRMDWEKDLLFFEVATGKCVAAGRTRTRLFRENYQELRWSPDSAYLSCTAFRAAFLFARDGRLLWRQPSMGMGLLSAQGDGLWFLGAVGLHYIQCVTEEAFTFIMGRADFHWESRAKGLSAGQGVAWGAEHASENLYLWELSSGQPIARLFPSRQWPQTFERRAVFAHHKSLLAFSMHEVHLGGQNVYYLLYDGERGEVTNLHTISDFWVKSTATFSSDDQTLFFSEGNAIHVLSIQPNVDAKG